jgi:hypothetical protein
MLFLIKQRNRSELPANWKIKKLRFLLKITNKTNNYNFFSNVYLKVGILINRSVQFVGSETKQPGRNSRPKLKIVPNYSYTVYILKITSKLGTVRAGDLGQISTLTLDCGPMESCIILPLVLFF